MRKEKKIEIPAGMKNAVAYALSEHWKTRTIGDGSTVDIALEAALRWLSENPIVPTLEQAGYMYDGAKGAHDTVVQYCMTEWQRCMFLTSENPK